MKTRRSMLAASLLTLAFLGCAAPVGDPTEQGDHSETTGTSQAADSYDACYQACAAQMCNDWSSDDPALPSCTSNADSNCSSKCSGKRPGGGGTNRRIPIMRTY